MFTPKDFNVTRGWGHHDAVLSAEEAARDANTKLMKYLEDKTVLDNSLLKEWYHLLDELLEQTGNEDLIARGEEILSIWG